MAQDTITLHVEPRKVTGKAVKHLRKAGTLPAVIHDHGKASLVIQGDYVQMSKVYKQAGKHHPIELIAGDKKFTTIIKKATFEPRKNQLNHLVFNAVKANEKVEAEVPIQPRYDEGNEVSPAERTGLMVISNVEMAVVKAFPKNLPNSLEYDAEKLVEIGDSATVADLIVPEGVEIITEPETTIATVYEPSALAAANDAAGGDAEPEDAEQVAATEGSSDTAAVADESANKES